MIWQRQHKDVLVLAGANLMVPELLVLVRARVLPALPKGCDVGRWVLVVEEALQSGQRSSYWPSCWLTP